MANVFSKYKEYKEKALILDALSEHLPIAMWARDMRGDRKYIWVSENYEKTFRIPKENMLGKTPYEVFDKKHADVYDASDLRILHGGEVAAPIKAQVGYDGQEVDIWTVKGPLKEGGEITGTVGFSIPAGKTANLFKKDFK